MSKKPAPPKPWELTQAQIDTITDSEFRYGTMRMLPPVNDIPKEFFSSTNIYVRIVDALYVGEEPPFGQVDFNPGFRKDGRAMMRVIMAHLRCVQPDYDHKIAGIALMISKVVHITAILT